MTDRTESLDMLLSPLGRRRNRPAYPLAPRVEAGLKGATIGLLDNSKQNASVLLDRIEQIFAGAGAGSIVRVRKASAAMSAGKLIDDLVEQCDAVVNAFGDCGSCTSWCIHDSVDIERRGVPVATINTNEFAGLGHYEAAALGMPDLPIVAIPHPVGNVAATVVGQFAQAAIADIVTVLTRGTDDRRTDYGVGGVAGIIASAEIGENCGCSV